MGRWFPSAAPCSLVLSLAAAAHAQATDPCDFATGGGIVFSEERVLSCYQRVPFEPADLQNIVGVVAQTRSFSDLAGIYEERVGWRRALDAVARRAHASDFELHDALK